LWRCFAPRRSPKGRRQRSRGRRSESPHRPPATQRCARCSRLFACAAQARAEEPQRGADAEQAKAPFPSVPTHGRAAARFPPSAPTGRRGGSQAHGSAPATLRRQPRAGLRAHAGVSQAIAQLAPMFPSLSASAIADALGKAGGDVEHAADALVMAQVSRQPRARRCTSGCDCTGTYCVIRWSCFESCSTEPQWRRPRTRRTLTDGCAQPRTVFAPAGSSAHVACSGVGGGGQED
jgi:hypothetical protein